MRRSVSPPATLWLKQSASRRADGADRPTLASCPSDDVLGFRADWLGALPVPPVLACQYAEAPVALVPGERPRRPLAAPTFAGREYSALVLMTEHDRAMGGQLGRWLDRKRTDPHWRLTPTEARGGLREVVAPLGWTLERVLRRLGLRLVKVWL